MYAPRTLLEVEGARPSRGQFTPTQPGPSVDDAAFKKRAVEGCEDEDFDRFVAQGVRAMLRSKGFDSDQLKEAMTMGTVETEFRRGWDDVRQQGIEVGQVRLLSELATRKFGREAAEELARVLARTSDGEQINRAAAAIVDCDEPEDFLERVRGG